MLRFASDEETSAISSPYVAPILSGVVSARTMATCCAAMSLTSTSYATLQAYVRFVTYGHDRRCYGRGMQAATWTAIGILAAAMLGTLVYLGGRIDALAARIDARFNALENGLGGRIDAVGSRIDALGARVDALSGRMDTHIDRHAAG